MGAKPAKKRVQRLYEKVREYLYRGRNDPLDDVVAGLNRMLNGWAQYFSYGTVVRVYRLVDYRIRNRFRWWLCRRHKVRGQLGTRRFPDVQIYGEIGLISLERLQLARRSNAMG